MSEWQPIETAPKDGQRALLWSPKWSAPSTGQFYGTKWAVDEAAGMFRYQPTHWMPLPPFPPIE